MGPERGRRLATVRVRVTLLATLVVAGVLVVASVVLVDRQRDGLLDQLDDTLSAEAERVRAAVEATGAVPTLDEDDDRIVAVVAADGTVLAASGRPDAGDHDGDDDGEVGGNEGADEDGAWRAAFTAAGAEADDDGRDVTLDGEPYRVVAEPAAVRGGEGRVLVAGARDDVDESVDELGATLGWTVPLSVVALALVVWIVVGRTLRPVERIRAQVAGIGLDELDRRVPVPAGDDEIARLAVTMNAMLERLEEAVRRQQRFVADASHELRTPLTRMRAELEVDERDPARADPAATRRSQLEEIDALQRMIEDLLVLARGDAGRSGDGSGQRVDLDDVVLGEVRTAGDPSTGGRTDVAVDASGVSAAQVVGDPGELRRVVRNLLDNARRHARGAVTVTLAERDGRARLVVSDDGPGIPAERRAEVFERFTRLDEARSGGGRAGLGLAIVHDIVRRHGGTVAIDDGPAGGTRVTVTLPAS
jgi:signal transduction histidine kinase